MVTGLDYYRQIIGGRGCESSITLSPDECAAILQIHDYGPAAIAHSTETAELMNSFIGKLKDKIWP
jgi:hypothetical protein